MASLIYFHKNKEQKKPSQLLMKKINVPQIIGKNHSQLTYSTANIN